MAKLMPLTAPVKSSVPPLAVTVPLPDNGNLANAQVRAGCEVTLDPAAETTTCPDCNKLLTREYRKGFEVPAKA